MGLACGQAHFLHGTSIVIKSVVKTQKTIKKSFKDKRLKASFYKVVKKHGLALKKLAKD
jgi:hypothetical protein